MTDGRSGFPPSAEGVEELRGGIRGGNALLRFCIWLLCLLWLPVCSLAAGRVVTVTDPEALQAEAFLVQEYSGTVTVTFLGDCTLGCEEKNQGSPRSFPKVIGERGYGWPFQALTRLTAADDLTVVNLEGVLSDRELTKELKTYNFIGPTANTRVLTEGGVECVTLANNHSRDYGDKGYADTKAALETAGIGWFGTDAPAMWDNGEGLRVGFLGVSGSLSGQRLTRYREDMETLRDLGCAAVITVMHAGTEYEPEPDGYQRQIVERAVRAGTDLIIGHHPHIVQGYEAVSGVPVVYSLGNCVFGGNFNPRDKDALALQADLTFEEGTLRDMTLRAYPISISSYKNSNNYSPVFLTGKDAERVLNKMKESTGYAPGPFDEERGATLGNNRSAE